MKWIIFIKNIKYIYYLKLYNLNWNFNGIQNLNLDLSSNFNSSICENQFLELVYDTK